MGKVFVVGSINQDHVLVVDRRPGPGESVTGATLVTRCGGKGANQAAAAVQGGAAVTMLARVGADAGGVAQRNDLAMRGVDVSLVMDTADVATGAAFVTVTPDGENSVVIAPGANGRMQASDVKAVASLISESSVLVAQLEIPLDAVVEAVSLCGPNTPVLLNAAPYGALPGSMLARVDTLVVNETEAASLVGSRFTGMARAREIATTILGHGPRNVVVTMGARGAVVAFSGTCTSVPAPPVSVVDTTGAGDVFVGTLAALLADGQPLDRAVVTAVERASASVGYIGARRPIASGPGGEWEPPNFR
jgi:ribokinase